MIEVHYLRERNSVPRKLSGSSGPGDSDLCLKIVFLPTHTVRRGWGLGLGLLLVPALVLLA